MEISAPECARELLEAIPMTMRAIVSQMRNHTPPSLSIPQFRTLMFLRRREGSSLSDAAEHLGLALPSVSKLIDGLVARGMVRRRPHPGDRRRMTLALTGDGREALQAAREATQAHLAAVLARLPAAERATVAAAMRALRKVFAPDREQHAVRAS